MRGRKSVQPLQIKHIDKEPTSFNGWNPDSEGRFSIAYMNDGSRKYLCDGEEVSLADGIGALTGKDKIPQKGSGTFNYAPGQYERLFGTKEK